MPKNFNVVPKKFNLVPKNSIYCQEKIKISSKKIQNHAEKIQNSTKKAQKTTNRVDWILSEWVWESMITMFIASAKIQLLWATARLLVTRFNPYQPSWWVLPQGNEDVGSIQDFILLFFVWCESRELGGRGSSRFSCVTPVAEIFSSDRVAFRIPSSISSGAPLQKQPTALTRWLLPQKSPYTDSQQDSKCGSNGRCCEYGVWVDCRCMEFVVAGWCARKWVRLCQALRNKKFYFWWFGKSELKKTRVIYLLDLFEERGEKGAVWFSVCQGPLDHWANGGYIDVLLTCGECGFCSLGSWCYSKKCVKLGTKSMWHCSREVKYQQGYTLHTLGINCSRIPAHSVCLWPDNYSSRVQPQRY